MSQSHRESAWLATWRNLLLQDAVAKVRTEFSATQFQIFDLNVLKEWPAREVAKSLAEESRETV